MQDRTTWENRAHQIASIRESGNLLESRKQFLELLDACSILKASHDIKDLTSWIGIMGEWVIQQRLEEKLHAADLAKNTLEILHLMEKNSLKNPHGYRSILGTLIDSGQWEKALPIAKKMVASTPTDNPHWLGDSTAHLAEVLMRTGALSQAETTIDAALNNLNTNYQSTTAFQLAVWKSNALRIKSLLSYNQGNISEAKSFAQMGYDLAIKDNAVFRIPQLKSTLELVSQS